MLGAPVILIHLADFAAQLGEATGAGWERDTVMLELFSGEQRLTNMYRSHGHRAQWFDILGRGQSNDLLDPMGFMFALRETMRLSPGALLFAGVPCANWVWISCSTHLRHLSILGDERVDFVLKGNIIAARFALLCLVWSSHPHPNWCSIPTCNLFGKTMERSFKDFGCATLTISALNHPTWWGLGSGSHRWILG